MKDIRHIQSTQVTLRQSETSPTLMIATVHNSECYGIGCLWFNPDGTVSVGSWCHSQDYIDSPDLPSALSALATLASPFDMNAFAPR